MPRRAPLKLRIGRKPTRWCNIADFAGSSTDDQGSRAPGHTSAASIGCAVAWVCKGIGVPPTYLRTCPGWGCFRTVDDSIDDMCEMPM